MNTEAAEVVYSFVDTIQHIVTIKELNAEFGKVCKYFGFNKWACLQISAGPNVIREPLRRFFGNPPLTWMDRYKEADHIQQDVAAHQILLRTEPFWWSQIVKDCNLDKPQLVVFEEAKEFGLRHGLAVPIRFPDGSVWSCLLTSEYIEENLETKTSMFLAAQFYASRGMYLKETMPKLPNFNSRITNRQREIIDLLSQGFTQSQIAAFLGISSSTVFNLTNEAKERMNCKTVAQLVADSILCGEIERTYRN